MDELEERVFELEAVQSDKAPAKAFDALDLNIGGFLTQTYSSVESENSGDASFDETNFELLISAKLSEDVDFFAALGWLSFVKLNEDDPENRFYDPAKRASPRPAIILWAKQRFNDSIELKFGRYVTAWGIVHREHFPPTLLSQQQPQHLQPINGGLGGFRTIATFLNGLEATGKMFLGGTTLEYSAYVGNYTGPGAFVESEIIRGGLIGASLMGGKYQFGFNNQNGKKPIARAGGVKPPTVSPVGGDAIPTAVPGNYNINGVYLRISLGPFLLKSEAFTNSIDFANNNQSGIYVQPSYTFGRHIVFLRHDQFDGDTEDEIDNDQTEVTQQILGYNYLAVHNIRYRAEFLVNSLEDNDATDKVRSYTMIKLSAVFSF